MLNKKTTLLILCSVLASSLVFSQKIIDSVKIYDFPVREGVIYQYEKKSVYASFNAMPIINVRSNYDSVFHFEEGRIADIQKVDDFFMISVENKSQEIVVYSNLKTTACKIGDVVRRGKFIGAMEKDYDANMNQVDMLIFQKGKEIPYKKIMEYMRRKISSAPPRSYTL